MKQLPKSLTAERRNKLAQIIVSEGSAKAKELAEQFDVTTETIRKDLIYLEEQGIAKKSHGGAVASQDFIERPIAIKETENIELKTQIAQKVIGLIPENSVIFLDAGTTAYSVARLLSLRNGMTIISNSVAIIQLLMNTDNNVFILGGKVRGSSSASIGLWAKEALKTLQFDIALLGTDGTGKTGPCTASYDEAAVKKLVIERSKKNIVITDHTKFSVLGLFQFCEWSDTDLLITDDEADPYFISKIKESMEVVSG